jgi:hypothetical protein
MLYSHMMFMWLISWVVFGGITIVGWFYRPDGRNARPPRIKVTADHMASPARKFLMAGRAINLTHSSHDRFLDCYGPARNFLGPAVAPSHCSRIHWCGLVSKPSSFHPAGS